MLPSPHTRLMNCVIGLCKKTGDWPSTLADLGYEAQLIEKTIRTSGSAVVVPDIISVSNRLLHSVVFDCKGGVTIEPRQVANYRTLMKNDFVQYLDVYDRDRLQFDLCFTDFARNHQRILPHIGDFPALSFGDEQIQKFNAFKINTTDAAFVSPISLKDANEPLDYYPFSLDDEKCVIIPHLLRALLSLATEKGRDGTDVLADAILDDEEVLRKIHKMWKALSKEHRTALKTKIRDVLSSLRTRYPDTFGTQLQSIQGRHGYMVHGTLMAFKKTCQQIIADCQQQHIMTDFIQSRS